MANIKSAKKRARQAVTRRLHNMSIRSKYRTVLKKAKLATQAGNLEEATKLFRLTQSEGQKASKNNIIPANKISRDIKRLNIHLKKAANLQPQT